MPSAYDYNEDDTGPAISNDQSDADQGFAPGTNERPITPEELKAFEQKALVGAAPTPGYASQATIRDGKMYDPSGREVSSIGETPEQVAERFGATLPMGQREQQQLAQLEQGYNDLLRNPNIDPKAKHAMLADMSRQIRYGHWRMQYQLSQDRMRQRGERQQLLEEQIQGRHQVSANEAGLMGGNAEHFAQQIQGLATKFPDHDVEYSSKGGITIKPKKAEKGKPEKEADPVQSILAEQKAVKSLEPTFAAQPESVQKAFKTKYGEGAAAHGWAIERLAEKKKEQAAAKVATAAQSSGGSTAATSSAQIDQRVEVQKAINVSHQRDMAAIEKIARPEEREAKRGALTRMNTIMAQWAGKTPPENVREEVRRLKGIVVQQWPDRPQTLGQQEDGIDFSGGM